MHQKASLWASVELDDECKCALDGAARGQLLGRVVQDGRLMRVVTERGPMLVEPPRSDHRVAVEEHVRPICGDWVLVETYEGNHPDAQRGRVRRVLPRRNCVVRSHEDGVRAQPLVANIDEAWIVCGVDRDPRLRHLLRYQAIVHSSQATMVVVLNKIDTHDDVVGIQANAHAQAPDLEIISVSALTGAGMGCLQARLLPGNTIALFGASGAGKSTILNRLLHSSAQRTGAVRGSDKRGRHTTSGSYLMETPEGAFLIDTPGARELGLLGSSAGLLQTFDDIERHAAHCRFHDCRHATEPGCAVLGAIEQGLILPERFVKYLELCRETERRRHPRRRR